MSQMTKTHRAMHKGARKITMLTITAHIQLLGAAKNHFIDPLNKKVPPTLNIQGQINYACALSSKGLLQWSKVAAILTMQMGANLSR